MKKSLGDLGVRDILVVDSLDRPSRLTWPASHLRHFFHAATPNPPPMKISYPILSIAAVLSMAVSAAQAQILFTDTFDSGTGDWYRAGSVNTLANASGQLSWSPIIGGGGDADRQVIGRAFSAQTLAVGQTIRLSFDYTQNASTAGDIMRVGFYNVATPIAADGWSVAGTLIGAFSGYTGFIQDNVASNPIRTDSGTDTNLTTTGPTIGGTILSTISGNTVAFNIIQGTQYQVVFELTRTSLTQMDASFSLSGGATPHQLITGSTSIVQDNFNTVVLRSVGPTLFDNIQVEVTPDLTTPSTFQLVITPNGANFDFSWDSQTGKFYDLLTSTDLATPIAEWPVYDPDGPGGADPLGDIPSAGATTTLTAVPSSDPRRFFSIREND